MSLKWNQKTIFSAVEGDGLYSVHFVDGEAVAGVEFGRASPIRLGEFSSISDAMASCQQNADCVAKERIQKSLADSQAYRKQ